MQQILVLAAQTFRECVRNKILFILVFLGLIAICCSVFMPVAGGEGDKIRIVESTCLGTISFFGMLSAVLISATSIPSDIEYRLIWPIATKPISRAKIIFGKFFGFICVLFLLLLFMGGVSYGLIRFSALGHNEDFSARVEVDCPDFRVVGKPAKNIGNVVCLEGGGNGSFVWDIKGLSYKNNPKEFEIEAKLLVESRDRENIPINVKIINHYTGNALTETMEAANNKLASLKIEGKALEGSRHITVVLTPVGSGDFIGIRSDSVRFFWEKRGFGYNFFKALAIILFQFILMLSVAILGSTFLSLPINILFCLFVFFCGNIIDFMRDLSTVINLFGTTVEHYGHSHAISTLAKESSTIMFYLNYIVKKPLLLLSYVLPDFKNFYMGNYLLDSINIPFKKVYTSFGYMCLYSLFCLPLSFLIFKRREIA